MDTKMVVRGVFCYQLYYETTIGDAVLPADFPDQATALDLFQDLDDL